MGEVFAQKIGRVKPHIICSLGHRMMEDTRHVKGEVVRHAMRVLVRHRTGLVFRHEIGVLIVIGQARLIAARASTQPNP